MSKCICCGREYDYSIATDPSWMYVYHDKQCRDIGAIAREFNGGSIDAKEAKAKLAKIGITTKAHVPVLLPNFADAIFGEDKKPAKVFAEEKPVETPQKKFK